MSKWGALYPAVLFGPPEGQTIEVQGLEVVRTTNGIHYPISLLAERVHLFEGKPIYARHRTYGQGEPQKVGRVILAYWDPRRCEVRGAIEITNPLWQQHLKTLSPAELPGLSPVFGNVRRGLPGASLVEQIRSIESIDLTDEPYSSGGFLGTDAIAEVFEHFTWERCSE